MNQTEHVHRVSPGRSLHTARGTIHEHATVEARDVGGEGELQKLIEAGAVYVRPNAQHAPTRGLGAGELEAGDSCNGCGDARKGAE